MNMLHIKGDLYRDLNTLKYWRRVGVTWRHGSPEVEWELVG